MARQAGRFEEIIPAWVFAVRGTVPRLLVAVVVTAAVIAPFWLADEPPDLRLGPLLVLGLVVVAALAGWWPTAIAGAAIVPTYWIQGVPPDGSLAMEKSSDLPSFLAITVMAAGLVVLTHTMQRAMADVRELDERRQLDNLAEALQRVDAERDAAQTMAVLDLSTALATTRGAREVAERALAELRLPVAPTSASIAIVEGGHLRMLAVLGADPRSVRRPSSASSWATPAGSTTSSPARPPSSTTATSSPRAPRRRRAAPLSHRVLGRRSLPLRGHGRPALGPLPRATAAVGAPPLLLVRGRDPRHRAPAGRVRGAAGRPPRRAREDPRRARPHRPHPVHHAPAPEPPRRPGFTASAWLIPASRDELAGDFYDLFRLDDGGWVAVLGDVCGKGAEAAAVTSLARYAARVTALDDPDPLRIAEVGNNALTLDPSDLFCTMASCATATASDELDVTLAGHPQVRLIRDGKVRRVGRFGPALGLANRPHTVSASRSCRATRVVLFSDGLIERSSHFGEEQLDEALAAGPPGDADAVARTLRKVVLEQRADRSDDLAALVITRTA